jgi:hypothetical protein
MIKLHERNYKKMTRTAIQVRLYDYIRVADDKKLRSIYNLLENEINQTTEWWQDKEFVAELDRRFDAVESGEDKGFTIEELNASISKLRKNKNGK